MKAENRGCQVQCTGAQAMEGVVNCALTEEGRENMWCGMEHWFTMGEFFDTCDFVHWLCSFFTGVHSYEAKLYTERIEKDMYAVLPAFPSFPSSLSSALKPWPACTGSPGVRWAWAVTATMTTSSEMFGASLPKISGSKAWEAAHDPHLEGRWLLWDGSTLWFHLILSVALSLSLHLILSVGNVTVRSTLLSTLEPFQKAFGF